TARERFDGERWRLSPYHIFARRRSLARKLQSYCREERKHGKCRRTQDCRANQNNDDGGIQKGRPQGRRRRASRPQGQSWQAAAAQQTFSPPGALWESEHYDARGNSAVQGQSGPGAAQHQRVLGRAGAYLSDRNLIRGETLKHLRQRSGYDVQAWLAVQP